MPSGLEHVRGRADDLLGRIGESLTIRRVERTIDPITGESTEVTHDLAVTGVVQAVSEENRIADALFGDLIVKVPAATVEADPDFGDGIDAADLVLRGSGSPLTPHRIVAVQPEYTQVGETSLFYVMQLRP